MISLNDYLQEKRTNEARALNQKQALANLNAERAMLLRKLREADARGDKRASNIYAKMATAAAKFATNIERSIAKLTNGGKV